jgi:hypothetical protein
MTENDYEEIIHNQAERIKELEIIVADLQAKLAMSKMNAASLKDALEHKF